MRNFSVSKTFGSMNLCRFLSVSTSLPQHYDIRFTLNDILDLRSRLSCSATYFVKAIRTGEILVNHVILRFVAARCARNEEYRILQERSLIVNLQLQSTNVAVNTHARVTHIVHSPDESFDQAKLH